MPWDPARTVMVYDYRGTDDMLLILPRAGGPAGRVPLIYAHGFGGGAAATAYRTITQALDDLRPIAALGHPVAVPDLGGVSTWGNDDSWDAIDDTITYLGANFGCRTDKVAVAGESMGGLTALNWAWRFASKVACIWLRNAVCDFAVFHARNAAFQGAIETAYGGLAAWQAALPTHDPNHANQTAALTGFRDRAKAWITSSDELIPVTDTRAFAARLGWPVAEFPGDHAAGVNSAVKDTTSFVVDTIDAFS